jgi:hypothetical protein
LTPRRPAYALLDLRRHSLLRGNLLVLLSFAAAFRISGFPAIHTAPLLLVPALLALLGAVDTVRCMQPRWDFYHGGVLLCLYMDLMVLCLILFFLLSPYLL